MSVMVLRTQGPAALFDDHRLVLHTSSHDAKWARVFHACGEFAPLPRCPAPVDSSAQAPGCPGGQRNSQMRELWAWPAGIWSTGVARGCFIGWMNF